MAELGVAGGILAMVFSAVSAVYTLWLLQSLYHELKRKQVRSASRLRSDPAAAGLDQIMCNV